MKPLLIFGLRGTLVERIHVRKMPAGMPQPDLTVGLSKVWLRPEMLATLLALQEHCNLALWSSTTLRNTTPLVEAVFSTQKFFETFGAGNSEEGAVGGEAAAVPVAEEAAAAGERRRFSKRRDDGQASSVGGPFKSPINFQFVWSREHTKADDFRRRNAIIDDDAHATVKDLEAVFRQFPAIAQPHNTILIDDTPSKTKQNADSFLWLDSCEGLRVQDSKGMADLRRFVLEEVCKAKDVRDLLPHRIRSSPGAQ